MKKKSEQHLEWLEMEKLKDKMELEKSKSSLINELKKYKKEDIIPAPKKITLWQKIRKVLNF